MHEDSGGTSVAEIAKSPADLHKARFIAKSSLRREFREGKSAAAAAEMCAVIDKDGTLSVYTVGDDGDVYWHDELPDGRWETTCLDLKKMTPNSVTRMDAYVDPSGVRYLVVAASEYLINRYGVTYLMRDTKANGQWQLLKTAGPFVMPGAANLWFGSSPESRETVLYQGIRDYSYYPDSSSYLQYWSSLATTPVLTLPDWLKPRGAGAERVHWTTGRFNGMNVLFSTTRNDTYSDIGVYRMDRNEPIPDRYVDIINRTDAFHSYVLTADDPRNPSYSGALCGVGNDNRAWGSRVSLKELSFVRHTASGKQAEKLPVQGEIILPRRGCLLYYGKKIEKNAGRPIGFELFAYSQAKQALVHFTEDRESGAWSGPFPLFDVASPYSYALCQTPDGSPVLFARLRDGRFIRATRDAAGNWRTRDVVLRETQQLVEYQAYVSEITVVDENDVPIGGVEVTLKSNHVNELVVNQEVLVVDDRGCVVHTDPAGRLLISDEVDGLSTFVTRLYCEGLAPLALDPVEPTFQQLNRIESAEDLRGKQVEQPDGTTKPLLPDYNEANAKAAASALKSAMTMAVRKGKRPAQAGTRIHPHSDPVLREIAAEDLLEDLDEIALEEVPEQHWTLAYDPATDQLTFETLSAEVARERIERMTGDGALLSDASWGDFFRSIWSGLTQAVEITVNTVKDAVQAVVRIGDQVWRGTISAVAQAYDAVRFVLQTIKVKLETAWQWLGFVFNTKDIRLVREAVKYLMFRGLDSLRDGMSQVDAFFKGASGEARETIQKTFRSLIGKIQDQSISDIASQAPPLDPRYRDGQVNNVFSHAIDAQIRAGATFSMNMDALVMQAVDDSVWEEIKKVLIDFESLDEYKQAGSYFQEAFKRVADDPRQFIAQGLSGLLQIISALLQSAVELAEKLMSLIARGVDQAVNSVKDFLNGDMPDSLLARLYQAVTGERSVKLADLMASAIALPAGILYKILNDRPMFPDEKSVNDFKAEIERARLGTGRSPQPFFSYGVRLIGKVMVIIGGIASIFLNAVGDYGATSEKIQAGAAFFLSVFTAVADIVFWFGSYLVDAVTAMPELGWVLGGIPIVGDLVCIKFSHTNSAYATRLNAAVLVLAAVVAVVSFIAFLLSMKGKEWDWPATANLLGFIPPLPRVLRIPLSGSKVLMVVQVLIDLVLGVFGILAVFMDEVKPEAAG